ncbi:peptidase M50 family, partial [Trifolium pratense]
MGYPSIEAAIKLEKKRTDRKLKELDTESTKNNPIVAVFNNLLKSCFGFDTFFATDVRRFGDGGIFIGNLRRPIDEVIPKLEKKLSDEAGREVVLWFMEEQKDDITKQ